MPWVILAVGLVILLGELIRVQYYTGNIIGTYPIYAKGKEIPAVTFMVSEEDLPVRANFTTNGRKNYGRKFMTDGAEFDIRISPSSGIKEKPLRISLNDDDDSAGHLKHQTSVLLKSQTTGQWSMSLALKKESKFKVENVSTTIRLGSEPARKSILASGGALAAIGLI